MTNLMITFCPAELSLTNCVIVHPDNYERFAHGGGHCAIVKTTGSKSHVFTVKTHENLSISEIGCNKIQRNWALISENEHVTVYPYTFNSVTQHVEHISLYVDFMKESTSDPYNVQEMSTAFVELFQNQAFTQGQELLFQFIDKKMLLLTVKEMRAPLQSDSTDGITVQINTTEIGLLLSDATVCFESKENCLINLEGETKGKSYGNFDINLDWDFQKMGVGGLDENLTAIFRRAFASRVFPPETIEKIGCKHVRGILMYGPPGTGKTLIARKIGNMLNTTQPKIVNGPEILNKYVGEAEANIRKLFADAEFEQKKFGMKSNLHMIIFDEIDAICKVRGSVSNSSGVHDTIVNQLLSKMDGINQLNNILIIGMTNRRDMIDEALLRPGRFEVQIEIGLPDENGRLKILEIHTSKMKENSMLPDIDLKYLAKHTKNFTGAEIEGLTKSASSWAMYKYLKPESSEKIKTNFDSVEIEITMADFLHALEHDIKPAFGSSIEQVDSFLSQDIILWGSPVSFVLNEGELFVKQVNSPEMIGVVSVLLEGSPNSGKTALAAKIAKNSCFPFVKVCSPEDMIGYSESDKCLAIKKLFDNAHKSPVSCIIIDNIERLLDYTAVGPHFSNSVLQSLLILLKKEPPKGRRLLILGTTSNKVVLESMELVSAFTETIHVPNLSCIEHLMAVLENTKCFNEEERNDIKEKVSNHRFSIPIKKLLRYVDMAKQIDGSSRVDRFVSKLRNTFL